MQKLFVTGGSGFIGSKLISLILKNNKNFEIHTIYNKNKIMLKSKNNFFKYKINLANKKLLFKKLKKIDPDIIINLAGFKNPRKNQLNKKKSYIDNFVINKLLVDFCKINRKKIIFTSTDLVYSDLEKKPPERGNIKPSTIYGKNKLKSEKYIKKNLKKYLILRFATVYDEMNSSDTNFINFSYNSIKRKRKIIAASNVYRSFISIQLLTKIIVKLIFLGINGTFNVGEKPSSYYNKIKSICIKKKIKYKNFLSKQKLNIVPEYRELDLKKINLVMKK